MHSLRIYSFICETNIQDKINMEKLILHHLLFIYASTFLYIHFECYIE